MKKYKSVNQPVCAIPGRTPRNIKSKKNRIRKKHAYRIHPALLKVRSMMANLIHSVQYILDKQGNPKKCNDLFMWERQAHTLKWRIARTQHDAFMVSTVFLGIDHGWGDGPPILFETMCFGGPLDQDQNRATTKEQAQVMHDDMVARCEAALDDIAPIV